MRLLFGFIIQNELSFRKGHRHKSRRQRRMQTYYFFEGSNRCLILSKNSLSHSMARHPFANISRKHEYRECHNTSRNLHNADIFDIGPFYSQQLWLEAAKTKGVLIRSLSLRGLSKYPRRNTQDFGNVWRWRAFAIFTAFLPIVPGPVPRA